MTDSSTHTDLFTVLQKQRLKLRKPGEASEKEKTKENPSHLFSKSVLNCFLSSVYDWEKRFHQDNQSKFLYFFKSVKHFYCQDQFFLFIVKKKRSWETFFFCSLVVNTGEKTHQTLKQIPRYFFSHLSRLPYEADDTWCFVAVQLGNAGSTGTDAEERMMFVRDTWFVKRCGMMLED